MTLALMVVLKGCVVLACAAVVALLWRRGSAAARHAVWALGLVGVLAVPVATMVLPRVELPVWVAVREGTTPSAPASVASRLLFDGTATPPNLGGVFGSGVWAVGFLFVLLRFLRARWTVRGLMQTSTETAPGEWDGLVAKLSAELSIRKTVRLVFLDGAISPMTWGIFRGVVLLPKAADEWTEERKRLVLAHELAHVKRHDGLMQVVVQFACALYWFNPLVWYAAYRLCAEREQACDDQVLRLGTSATDYAEHLVEITRSMRRDIPFSFAGASMAQPSQLESRVLSILNPRVNRRTLSKSAAFVLATIVASLTLSMSMIGFSAPIPFPPEPPIPTVPENLVALNATPVIEPAAPKPAPMRRQAQEPEEQGPFRIGPDVTPPTVVSKVDPQYPDEAKRARYQGKVVVEAIVYANGTLKVQRVIQELEYGLTEKAVEALEQWKFKPAMRKGKPVDVRLNIEVNFNLR